MSDRLDRIRSTFDRDALRTICTLHEEDFGQAFALDRTQVEIPERTSAWFRHYNPGPAEDFYFHRDNGSSVLAVAHLDTCIPHEARRADFVETGDGEVVISGALDDRLGAYVILDLLPKLGITYDVLLTVGEESGESTAQYFETDKRYDWVIEFDRGGTDVVMYDYDDDQTRDAVRAAGARVGSGSFSDIAFMEHLRVKAFNWGVGYGGDYHSVRGHAYLEDTFSMVERFMTFHDLHYGTHMPHVPEWRRTPEPIGGAVDGAEWDDYDESEGGWDDDGIYFDREYIDNPTPEQIRAAAERGAWV